MNVCYILFLNIDNIKLKITEIDHNISKFKGYETQIEENKQTQFQIEDVDDEIIIINDDIGNEYDDISEIERDIALQEKEISNIKIRIEKYIYKKKREE